MGDNSGESFMRVLRKIVSVVLAFSLVFFYSSSFMTVLAEGNGVPSIQGLGNVTILEDETTTLHFTVSDDATPAGDLTVSAVSNNPEVLGSLSPINDNGSVSMVIAPKEHKNGTANITVTVTDAEEASVSQTVVLTVTPVNYAPEAGDVSIKRNGVERSCGRAYRKRI